MTQYFVRYFAAGNSSPLQAGPYTLDEALKQKQEMDKNPSVADVCIEEMVEVIAEQIADIIHKNKPATITYLDAA